MTLTTKRLAWDCRIGLVTAVAGLMLGACGQSGPLYLPGNPSEIQVENPEGEAATDGIVDDDQADNDQVDERAEIEENSARE